MQLCSSSVCYRASQPSMGSTVPRTWLRRCPNLPVRFRRSCLSAQSQVLFLDYRWSWFICFVSQTPKTSWTLWVASPSFSWWLTLSARFHSQLSEHWYSLSVLPVPVSRSWQHSHEFGGLWRVKAVFLAPSSWLGLVTHRNYRSTASSSLWLPALSSVFLSSALPQHWMRFWVPPFSAYFPRTPFPSVVLWWANDLPL